MGQSPGPSVFDLSESVRPGDLSGAGGRGKTKTKNKGGPGAQGLQAAPRRGPKGESWGILGNLGESWEDHAWLTTCIEASTFDGASLGELLEISENRRLTAGVAGGKTFASRSAGGPPRRIND